MVFYQLIWFPTNIPDYFQTAAGGFSKYKRKFPSSTSMKRSGGRRLFFTKFHEAKATIYRESVSYFILKKSLPPFFERAYPFLRRHVCFFRKDRILFAERTQPFSKKGPPFSIKGRMLFLRDYPEISAARSFRSTESPHKRPVDYNPLSNKADCSL